MSKKEHGLIYTIVFTFIVCFIFVFGLVFVNQQTAAIVLENKTLASQSAILNAFGITYSSREEIAGLYQQIEVEDRGDVQLFKYTEGGEVSYAKRFFGSGLWGRIDGVLAVSADMKEIVGLEIISHNETPGLGGRIDEAWFKAQFRNEKIVNSTVTVGRAGSGDEDPDNGTVDAITGASRTSAAIQVIMNNELPEIAKLIGVSL